VKFVGENSNELPLTVGAPKSGSGSPKVDVSETFPKVTFVPT